MKIINPEKADSIPQIKQQLRNIRENTRIVIFIVEDSDNIPVVVNVEGELDARYLAETRYVLSYRGNIVSLSLSYTGSGTFSGIYMPYGETSFKLVQLIVTGFTNDGAIGKVVKITNF